MQQDINQHWNKYYEANRDFALESSQEINKFLSYCNPNAPKAALDIGCGTGQLTRELWHHGYKTVGVDVSSEAIKLAKASTILPASELYYQRADIEQADLSSLPLQPYGLITCNRVYAFIQNKATFLDKVAGLLDDNGTFIVITPRSASNDQKKPLEADQQDIDLLAVHFDQVDYYERQRVDGLRGYFIGYRKV